MLTENEIKALQAEIIRLSGRSSSVALIEPAPVVRDKNGFFQHAGLPDFEEGDGDKCKAWIAEQELEVAMVSIECAAESVSKRYFEAGDPDCSYWEPDRPDGGDWFCLAIHDTEDAQSAGGRAPW
jgi:hypothetical protein